MEKVKILLCLILLTIATGICLADSPVDLAKENAELKQRVDKLEKEVEELKKLVIQQSQAKPAEQPVPLTRPAVAGPSESNAVPLKLSEEDMKKIMAMLEKETSKKKPVWAADLDVQFYGRLKLDAAYDSSRTDVGNYIKWVRPQTSIINEHGEFNITANETRLGLNISGPESEAVKTSGRLEIDFYGGGAENKSNPMLRHAYLNIEWPEEKFSILAGQTSDVISPLFPYTLNYSVAWWAGNIGYRRPQIRLTKSYAIGHDVDLKLEAAATRNIGISGNFVVRDAGEDSGIPGVQARASVKFPWLKEQPTTIGVSGHWAKEKHYTSATGADHTYDSWSLNLDVTQPINKWLAVKGELFTGQDLSAYLGGIGNGVNTVLGREIASKGGWVAASLTPNPKWNFNFGITVDDPKNSNLAGMPATDARVYNRSIFGNAIYSINKNTEVGFELSQWRTDYRGGGNENAIRAQTSFIYKF
jgi:hypothetical protein